MKTLFLLELLLQVKTLIVMIYLKENGIDINNNKHNI